MTRVSEETAGKTRDLPIDPRLKWILGHAGSEAGIDLVRVYSGGQCTPGGATKRAGSHRHDLGGAADLELWQGGRALDITSQSDLVAIRKFISAAARLGATGFGAGVWYMGVHGIHVGFGKLAVWGSEGQPANAPEWLREAARQGWEHAGVSLMDLLKVDPKSQQDDCSVDCPGR